MIERVRLKPKIEQPAVPSRAGRLLPFGPAPLLHGEAREGYNKILERVFSALKPRNFFEETCAAEYADREWTIDRLCRGKASHLNRHVGDGLKVVLGALLDYDPVPDQEKEKQGIADWEALLEEIDPFGEGATVKYFKTEEHLKRLRYSFNKKQRAAHDAQLQELVDPWVKHDPDAIKKVNEILAAAGMTMADVMAATQNAHWTATNVYDHQIAVAKKEAAAILREFEWRRRKFTRMLEDETKEIEGEWHEIPSAEGEAA
jgi:hypothetical protein